LTVQSFLNQIWVQLGDEVIDNIRLAKNFDLDASFVEQKLGFIERRRLKDNANVLDLLRQLISSQKAQIDALELQSVRALIWVSQTSPYNGIPHLASAAVEMLGLSPDVLNFDLGLGCSGYPVALDMAQKLLANVSSDRNDSVIVITGDAYSNIIDENDRDTALIFGDGLSLTQISNVDHGLSLKIKTGVSSHTEFSEALSLASGVLGMRGRDVYNYVLKNVALVADHSVRQTRAEISELACVYAHQGSRHIVRQVGRALGVDEIVCPFYSSLTGNMVSTSIPFGLVQCPPKDGLSMLIGFGVGLQTAAIIVEK